MCACLTVLALLGCHHKEYSERFTIANNGSFELIELYQLEGIELYKPITSNELFEEKEYDMLNINSSVKNEVIMEAHTQLHMDSNGVVPVELYPYVVRVPFTSSHLIAELPKSVGDKRSRHLVMERCERVSVSHRGVGIQIQTNPQKVQSLYSYGAYIKASELAARYMLNNVTDLCLYYYDVEGGYSESYDIQSNTIRIDAQEIKDALNAVGILHE